MTQPVKFGLNVDPNTGGLPNAERITAIAEASGLDYVGIQDHPYNADFTDTLTLITWLAARTRHVHLFPNVATESQMNAFVFWPSGDRERQSRLFAEQVVPAVRESVARLAPPP